MPLLTLQNAKGFGFNLPSTAISNSYESIATVNVGSNGNVSVDFNSISSDYQHLQIRGIVRSEENAASAATLRMQFNGDTNSNYSDHYLTGSGSGSTTSNGAGDTSYIAIGYVIPKDGLTASVYGSLVIDILDYKDTNKYKTVSSLNGYDLNGSGNISATSGLWRNTNAISSIKIYFNVYDVKQYSHFALYGIKGVA